jgi:hypothetical protein
MAEVTHFAMKALSLAETFKYALGGEPIALGLGRYRVELSAPEGPSTGGGKQAVQHVKLVPLKQGAAVIVAGAANQVERTAELRSFEHLAALYAERYRGKRIPVDRNAYNQLLRRIQEFFSAQRMSVVMLEAPPAAATAAAQPGASPALVVALMLVGALLVGGALFLLLTHH